MFGFNQQGPIEILLCPQQRIARPAKKAYDMDTRELTILGGRQPLKTKNNLIRKNNAALLYIQIPLLLQTHPF